MNTIKIDKYFRGMIANNGLSGIETENTIFAFLAAANRSYYGISCELSLSKDNKYIVTGCDSLLKYGMLNLDIRSFSYNELKKFSLIDRKTGNLNEFVFIPRLEDYLAICKAYQKSMFIKIKDCLKPEELEDLQGYMEDFGIEDNYSLISENKKQLQTLKKIFPANSLYYYSRIVDDESLDYCKKYGINLYVDHHKLKRDYIKNLHLVGLKVISGVVNDKEVAEKMIKFDVDFLFTNILE
ncbi:MAG: glycerophosphodiester phosphodiesterase family protein [Candidatus Izemoplasmatales bacterium]|nr:glycerophosphodiester phosphodiesterase family protein [Candidatus Izemoplasmatales bacterium]MDY0138478.1 glycerophosphodiester phosphodiesterase family protein [Candidatus Izemoplasmatales bacterium]